MKPITIKALAEYVIFNKVDVAVASADRFEQRMMALAFCVMVDELLPEGGVYSSGDMTLTLGGGSKVRFGYEDKHFVGRNFHTAVLDGAVDGGLATLIATRVRIPMGLGLVRLCA